MTGLTAAAFTTTLRRRSGGNLVASSEIVAIAEIGGGDYWIIFTPSVATLYTLDLASVVTSRIVDPSSFQVEVEASTLATVGPYLTTRDAVKASFGYSKTEFDAAIDALLPQVTKWFQTYAGRSFFGDEFTEYPPVLSRYTSSFFVKEPPIATVTSLHLSTSFPRVYDASTLLVEGTDFVVDETHQWIELVTPRWFGCYGSMVRMVKVVYAGGYDLIPADLQRAAEEVIGVKVAKSQDKSYHITSSAREDGSIQGLRFDDITPHALEVLQAYRLVRAA